jgi:hypothetical protein
MRMAGQDLSVDVLQQYRYEPVCVKTGGSYDKWVKQTFTYVPPWVYLLLVLGLIPLIIVYLIVRKQAVVHFPVVKGFQLKRNLLTIAITIALLAGLGFLIGAIADWKWGVVGIALLAASVVMGTIGMDRVWLRGRLRKDGETLTLSGAHPTFIANATNPTSDAAETTPELPA